MSGIMMGAATTPRLGPGGTFSATETVAGNTDNATYWVRGFVAATSYEYAETAITVGSLSATTWGSATVVGVFWRSTISYTGTGLVYVEITGNWSSGAVNSLSVAGVDQGSVGNPTYNVSTGTTTFAIGSAKTNPFGTSGTKAIVIT